MVGHQIDSLNRKGRARKITYENSPSLIEKHHYRGLLVEAEALGEIFLDSDAKIEEIIPVIKVDAEGNKSYWIPKLIDRGNALTYEQVKEAVLSKNHDILRYFYIDCLVRIHQKIQNGDFDI